MPLPASQASVHGPPATSGGPPPGGRTRLGGHLRQLSQAKVIAAVYVAAMFVNIMDITIVNVALPTLAAEFDVPTASIEWVVTGYLLSLAVWIPASGWIGDRFGTKRTFQFALIVFTVSSCLCGLATSLGELIAFRVLQGVGGGMLTPVGLAMLFRAFPPERRAAASRILIIPTALAPALGPVVGGLLIDTLSWRWVFFVNVPIGVVTFVFGALLLHEHREPTAGAFDLPGFLLSAAGLTLILLTLSEGPTRGWTSPLVIGAAIGGLAAVALLAVVELRVREPMLQLRLLGDRMFRRANAVSLFATAAFLGTLFLVPLYLQEVLGASPLESGLTTFPEAIGVLVVSQVVAHLYAPVGPRRLMVGGLVAMAGVLVVISRVELDTSLWTVRLLMFALGGCYAFMVLPLQASSFATISRADTGRASALYNTQRQVASALGVAIMATALSVFLDSVGAVSFVAGEVDAYQKSFLVAAGIALVGAVVASRVRDSDAAATMARGGADVATAASS